MKMERDLDLIRNLLLSIEQGQTFISTMSDGTAEALGVDDDETLPAEDAEKVRYHLRLLENAGYLDLRWNNAGAHVWGITWHGHDFLDSVRDDEIWANTKEGARKVGNTTLDFVVEIAKGMAKAKMREMGFGF